MRTPIWGLAGLSVAYVAGCSAISVWHSRALASVPVEASRVEVLRALGQPDVVEHAGVPFARYASSGCSGRCAQRWWYENRLGLDTEAWSVEMECFRLRTRKVARDITVEDRSKRMRIHRPFIFIASLALMAWCTLMGVLVLIYGFNEQGLRCGRLCSLEVSIRQIFGVRGFEILVVMGLFARALMCGSANVRVCRTAGGHACRAAAEAGGAPWTQTPPTGATPVVRCLHRGKSLRVGTLQVASAMQGVDDQPGGDLHQQVLVVGLAHPAPVAARLTQVITRIVVHPVTAIHFGPRQALTTSPGFVLPARRRRITVVWAACMRWRAVAARVVRRIGEGGSRGECSGRAHGNGKQTYGCHRDASVMAALCGAVSANVRQAV